MSLPPPSGVVAPAAGPRVAILLSTCNGTAFLPEQLRSFQDQTHRDWTLFWRDDGSTDDTVAVMERFAAAEPRCIRIDAPAGRLGATASFLALLRAVAPRIGPADLVAFSDQDDVWLPAKLARGVAALTGAGRTDGVPALYCARQRVVDAGLRRIAASPRLRHPPGFRAALAQNVAVGCTILLNPPAVTLIAGLRAPQRTYHDWWCYLAVTAAGGQCLHDDVEVILYRQHSGNSVGAPRSTPRRVLAALRRGPASFMNLLRGHLAALAARPEVLSATARADVVLLDVALRGGVRERLGALRTLRLRRQTLAETAALYLWFLLGGSGGR